MSLLRVMSFNVRYAEPEDGDHIWENRRELAASVIAGAAPDVVGLQEPLVNQLRDLDKALPEYGRFGKGRYGDDELEKFTAVYYRKDTIALLETEAFWYSETPDVPGSRSWLIHKPYVVNWARMCHRPTGLRFAFFNTHLPYKPEQAEARLRAAALLRDRARGSGDCSILSGDFNAPAGAEVYRILAADFRDAWSEAPLREGPEGTVHGFRGEAAGRRIDWILFRGPLRAESCRTLIDRRDGLFPSDHFPVVADLRPGISPQTAPPSANGSPPEPA